MLPSENLPEGARYWASKPVDELCRDLDRKIDQAFEWMKHTGQFDLWQRLLRQYYSGSFDAGALTTVGDQDEFVGIKVNHLHQVGEAIVTIVTGSRPYFEPHASNSDAKSAKQTIIASSLLENAMKQKDLEGVWIDAVRWAIQLRQSWLLCTWDATAGTPYAVNPDSNSLVKTGDINYRAFMPSDVCTDTSKDDADSHVWIITRSWVNKYDIIAKYPELADRLAHVQTKSFDVMGKRPRLVPAWRSWRFDSDDIAVWDFYHDKTDAMPNGRYTSMVDADLWLFDGPLPYDTMPAIRVAPEDQTGTQLGYTTLLDCMPLQQAVSALNSITISNLSTFGAGNVWTKTGEPLDVEDLAGGLKHLQSNTKPEPVDLVSVNSAIPETEAHLVNGIEILSGINPVARGSAEALEKGLSGSAYALFDAKSIQFLNGTQRAAVRALEFAASTTVSHYKRYGNAPMVLELAGKSRREYMQDFIGSRDLSGIQRVTVDIGSPLTRTTAGRMQLVETLMKLPEGGGIQTPKQVEQVYATGRLEPAIEATEAELLRIREENEALADGVLPVVFAYDNHPLDIKHHTIVLGSMAARQNPMVMQNALQHIAMHAQEWRTGDPAVFEALGIPPPPPPPMMTPPPAPGATHGTPPPKNGATSHTQPGRPGLNGPPPSLGGESPEPRQPSQPVNPETGQRAPGPMAP